VVEFLLLVIPIASLSSATIGVGWFAYAKTEARILASESAFLLTQPDSEPNDVILGIGTQLDRRLGAVRYKLEHFSGNGLREVALSLKLPSPIGVFSLGLPEIKVITHAANEI
jgi:hypothetical protein